MPTPVNALSALKLPRIITASTAVFAVLFSVASTPTRAKDLSHRKARIEELMFTFAQAFALDICAYAIMSNHYHLVVKMAVQDAKKWSAREVVQRWHLIFKGNAISQRFLGRRCFR